MPVTEPQVLAEQLGRLDSGLQSDLPNPNRCESEPRWLLVAG